MKLQKIILAIKDIMELTILQKSILGAIAGLGSYLVGCMDKLFVILTVFMLLDYITGIMTIVFSRNTFDVKKATQGIIRKLGFFVLFIVACLLDYVLLDFCSGYDSQQVNAKLVVLSYLIGTEGMSILGNLKICGVPIPKTLDNMFANIKEKC